MFDARKLKLIKGIYAYPASAYRLATPTATINYTQAPKSLTGKLGRIFPGF